MGPRIPWHHPRRRRLLLVQGARLPLVAWKHAPTPGQYVVRFLGDRGPVKLALSSARYTTALGDARGSWCLQVHHGSSLMHGIVDNVDESHGAELLTLPTWTRPRS